MTFFRILEVVGGHFSFNEATLDSNDLYSSLMHQKIVFQESFIEIKSKIEVNLYRHHDARGLISFPSSTVEFP